MATSILVGRPRGFRYPAKFLFERHVKKFGSGCWLWTAAKHKFGYGFFKFWYRGKKIQTTAHRAAWLLFRGHIASKRVLVCHKCDNPPCVNPWHGFLGTHKDNMQDAKKKGRLSIGKQHGRATLKRSVGIKHSIATKKGFKKHGRYGEGHHLAKMTNDQAREIQKRYNLNNATLKELADEYHLSQTNVHHIVKGHGRFKHIAA